MRDLEFREQCAVIQWWGYACRGFGLPEYATGDASNNNFGFERPQQALWMTHPKYGQTYRMPVYVDRVRTPTTTSWVQVPR